MDSKHLVDPELAPLLAMLPPSITLTKEILGPIRASAAGGRVLPDAPTYPDIERTEYFVPGPAGAPDVRIFIYLPKNLPQPYPTLFWVHGGGFIMGSIDNDDPIVKNLMTQVGCALVSVDYRLAPENPYPAAVEDCYAALKWVSTNASELGIDPERLAVGGTSAGAGLSAALALLTRDRGDIQLAFQLLMHPMLDDRTAVTTDPHPYAGEFIWNPQANHFGWESLLGQAPGSPDVSPYASAARATDLAGLPPTFISVGSLDLFVEEDLEYARRLIRAGVPTEFHLYPGGYHAFLMVATAQITKNLMRDVISALKRGLKIEA